jgi:capsular polysaccharide biosynthesis protein
MNEQLQPGAPVSIQWRTYGGVVRDRWRVLVAGAAIGALLSGGYLLAIGKTATATTDVNITVISTDPFSSSRNAAGLLDATTESKIATSQAVAAAAAEEVGDAVTAAQLRSGVAAELVSEATVMRISYSSPDPALARRGADAIAVAYLDYRETMAQRRLNKMYDNLEGRLSELRDELVDVNARSASAAGGSPEANQAESDRNMITSEINSLLESKNALDTVDTSGGSILNAADDNAVRTSPNEPLILLSGLLAGLTLGLVAAFAVRHIGRRRVRVASDLEQYTGGVIAEIAPASDRPVETFRYVRERLLAAFPPKARVIAIVDGSEGSHNGEIPAQLARVFDEIGRTATVVPVDGELAVTKAVLLDTKKVGSIVLLVVPADVERSAVLVVGRLADAAVFLVEPGATRASTLAGFKREFDAAGLPVLGSVTVPRGHVPVIAAHPVMAHAPLVAEELR